MANWIKKIAVTMAGISAASLIAPSPSRAEFPQQIERPPQFVLFSFDGSYNLGVWKNLRDFSKRQKDQGSDVKFTFFMSGVYFIQPNNRTLYTPPRHAVGKSDIGVGDNNQDITLRVDQVNKAVAEGHEMGSHANGHFDGSKWTQEEWSSEFSQFEKFIFDVFSLNKIDPNQTQHRGWLLKQENVKGFRAPLLGVGSGLWPALKEHQFSYDCSKIAPPNYWPEKMGNGLWNLPLAELKIAGTAKRTLSMDYNFYVAQSGGKAEPAQKETFKKQMYDTYINWFQQNYNGNRAPLNIGHHFSPWNNGAYMETLQKFAADVCGLPEVKCVNYQEYVGWLESLNPIQIANFKKGNFLKMEKPVQIAQVSAPLSSTVQLMLNSSSSVKYVYVRPLVQTQEALKKLRAQISVNGIKINKSALTLEDVQKISGGKNDVEITAHLLNSRGVEIARSTQVLHDMLTQTQQLSTISLESSALKGDLPEAHLDERNTSYDPNNLD